VILPVAQPASWRQDEQRGGERWRCASDHRASISSRIGIDPRPAQERRTAARRMLIATVTAIRRG
jgi:hypothetical protein